MVQVTMKSVREKRYELEDLLELQNKLMLMSSKGEHGREQVNRFTEVRTDLFSCNQIIYHYTLLLLYCHCQQLKYLVADQKHLTSLNYAG